MTRRAGRLTPEERVEVAARTLTRPWRKAPSNTSRSSKVNPETKQRDGNRALALVGVVEEMCRCAHLRGGTPPPTAPSSGGWSLIQLESAPTGPQHPLVPADPDSQVEVLPRWNVLESKIIILTPL